MIVFPAEKWVGITRIIAAAYLRSRKKCPIIRNLYFSNHGLITHTILNYVL